MKVFLPPASAAAKALLNALRVLLSLGFVELAGGVVLFFCVLGSTTGPAGLFDFDFDRIKRKLRPQSVFV